jgi:hypothetical protein
MRPGITARRDYDAARLRGDVVAADPTVDNISIGRAYSKSLLEDPLSWP